MVGSAERRGSSQILRLVGFVLGLQLPARLIVLEYSVTLLRVNMMWSYWFLLEALLGARFGEVYPIRRQ